MLAIAGGKGGCGKTTTTLGLGRALARRGLNPLIIDADVEMPDIHHVAGIERSYGIDQVAEGKRIEAAVQQSSSFPGLALLTAGVHNTLSDIVAQTRRWHGPVLVDCPAGISGDAVEPLRAVDETLVVSTDEPQCLDDTRRTVRVAMELNTQTVGAIVREIAGNSPSSIGGCSVLEVVRSVAAPFDAPTVRRNWMQVTNMIYPDYPYRAPKNG